MLPLCVPLFLQDLKQVEIVRAYLAKQTDEISLQQGDVVLVLTREEGKCALERVWFPEVDLWAQFERTWSRICQGFMPSL